SSLLANPHATNVERNWEAAHGSRLLGNVAPSACPAPTSITSSSCNLATQRLLDAHATTRLCPLSCSNGAAPESDTSDRAFWSRKWDWLGPRKSVYPMVKCVRAVVSARPSGAPNSTESTWRALHDASANCFRIALPVTRMPSRSTPASDIAGG